MAAVAVAAAAVQPPVPANHHLQLSSSQQSFKLMPLSLTKSSSPFRIFCPSSSSPSSAAVQDPADAPTATGGCSACGREEVEKGCNGEGRIQGGIATLPGFGWWPIKAYRPCPGLVASGGKYKRYGQSMDEVGFGRAQMGMAKETKDEADCTHQ